MFYPKKDICKDAQPHEKRECTVVVPRLLRCTEIVEQKERMIRKISALETAIELYANDG